MLDFLLSVNIPVFEIYGMSESSGPQTVSLPGKHITGTCGPVMPGAEIKIDPRNGEICFRGRHVFMGYMKNPEATASTIDDEGWLHSGDIGRIDNGFLTITGRIKELIITAGGENIAPVLIEAVIKDELALVSQCVVIGDRRKFLTCLLTLKADPGTDRLSPEAADFLRKNDVSCSTVKEAIRNPKVHSILNDGIKRANQRATSQAQTVKKFAILPEDFSMEGGELTPTLKLKRAFIASKYSKAIENLYGEADPSKPSTATRTPAPAPAPATAPVPTPAPVPAPTLTPAPQPLQAPQVIAAPSPAPAPAASAIAGDPDAIINLKKNDGSIITVNTEPVEVILKNKLKAVKDVILVGEGREYLACLLTLKTLPRGPNMTSEPLDPEALSAGAQYGSPATTAKEAKDCSRFRQYLIDGIMKANKECTAQSHYVRKFVIIPTDLSVIPDFLVNGKLSRKLVSAKYADVIEGMYNPDKAAADKRAKEAAAADATAKADAAAKVEADRLTAEAAANAAAAAAAKLAADEAARAEAARAEAARAEAARAEAARAEAVRAEASRLQAEEAARLEKARLATERAAEEERQRAAAEAERARAAAAAEEERARAAEELRAAAALRAAEAQRAAELREAEAAHAAEERRRAEEFARTRLEEERRAAEASLLRTPSSSQQLCGVGIAMQSNSDGHMYVARFVQGGAAERSGALAVGDVIAEVDGKNVLGLKGPDITQSILGPEGSTVVFKVLRGATREFIVAPVVRAPNPASATSSTRSVRSGVTSTPLSSSHAVPERALQIKNLTTRTLALTVKIGQKSTNTVLVALVNLPPPLQLLTWAGCVPISAGQHGDSDCRARVRHAGVFE